MPSINLLMVVDDHYRDFSISKARDSHSYMFTVYRAGLIDDLGLLEADVQIECSLRWTNDREAERLCGKSPVTCDLSVFVARANQFSGSHRF